MVEDQASPLELTTTAKSNLHEKKGVHFRLASQNNLFHFYIIDNKFQFAATHVSE